MSNIQNSNGNRPAGFRLDKGNAKIAGVCGGLANYFNVDPLIVRIVFAIGAVAGVGSFILIYLLIWLLAN
ncbi:PspC domain-containing protein [Erythrobacter sp. EC-HK427]|uniref:PspC domain-containing protein n=1 Tax=Erythrobacter sp. EC-HK427 TaxID=2038396 RepID=UPI00125C45CE|nr:PspC domain-containing protein [Erythrobacter sp. EC-HK427]VVS96967.1 conserved hypothetical protein [Erythrobacter sp. EC-HK427]